MQAIQGQVLAEESEKARIAQEKVRAEAEQVYAEAEKTRKAEELEATKQSRVKAKSRTQGDKSMVDLAGVGPAAGDKREGDACIPDGKKQKIICGGSPPPCFIIWKNPGPG